MKVANTNYVCKTFTPSNLYPCSAPPPRQVEERENEGPKKKQIGWREEMRAQRVARKRRQKLERLERTKSSAEYALCILQQQLADQARTLTEINQGSTAARHSTSEGTQQEVPLPLPPTWQPQQHETAAALSEAELKELTLAQKVPTAIADAGATSNCGMEYQSECGQFTLTSPFLHTGKESNKIFQYAGGGLAPATELRGLPMDVRAPADEVHIVPGIKNNLLSTSKFVDANYAWLFDNDVVSVFDKNNTEIKTTRAAVLKGWRSPSENLWRIPLVRQGMDVATGTTDTVAVAMSPQEILRTHPPAQPEELYSAYELRTKPELIRFYHAAAGFPTKPTWLAAIRNGHYSTWPGLNAKDVAKYFPESEEMWKGHGRKIRAGLRSTSKTKTKEDDSDKATLSEEVQASAIDPSERAYYTAVFNMKSEMDRKLYSDQTGKFPVTSYKGCQYIFVMFDMDTTNAILVEAMKNRTSGEMVRAYKAAMERLRKADSQPPTLHILDNECSQEFKEAIEDEGMKHQLVPPHDHRRNAAEKAVQIFKDHFIAVLCGTDATFPMKLWCQLLPHAEVQLNMLRKSKTKSNTSAFAHIHGEHDYDATPFGILGSRVEIHETPKQRRTFGAHTKTGYYLGPAWDHYRCHLVWVEDTRATRIGQTVFFDINTSQRPISPRATPS